MKKTAVVAGMIAVVVFVMGASAYLILTSDRTGPEILIQGNDDLLYRTGMEDSKLLDHMKAIDKKDGDVTDSLIIESVELDSDGTSAEVTYAAMDRHYNVTKLKRSLTVALDTPEASVPIQPAEQSPEEEPVNAEENVPKSPEGSPQIWLNEHEVSLPLGSKFNVLRYVEDIQDDKDDRDSLYGDIQVDGSVDVHTTGVYELSYYVIDSDGNRSNAEILRVTVQ